VQQLFVTMMPSFFGRCDDNGRYDGNIFFEIRVSFDCLWTDPPYSTLGRSFQKINSRSPCRNISNFHRAKQDKDNNNVWKRWIHETSTKTLKSIIIQLSNVVHKNVETVDTKVVPSNPFQERRDDDDDHDSWNVSPSVVFEEISYGSHPRQVVHLFQPTMKTTIADDPLTNGSSDSHLAPPTSLIFFVHGGAWGSGFPELYRLVATPFVRANYTVAIVGYRTYPTSNVQGQVKDIAIAMETLMHKLQHSSNHISHTNIPSHSKMDVTLMGHSSGAHLCALGILQGQIRGVDRLVGIAGFYDIPKHYMYEATRGVERISPMAPACGGASLNQWRRCSPTYILQNKVQLHVDGDVTNNPLAFPPTLLCHGTADATVPYQQTINFFQVLTQFYRQRHCVQMEILEGMEHTETVLQLMFGGPTRDVVLRWIQQGRPLQNTTK
jgi:acetyl esterase/lipase